MDTIRNAFDVHWRPQSILLWKPGAFTGVHRAFSHGYHSKCIGIHRAFSHGSTERSLMDTIRDAFEFIVMV